MTVQDLEGIRYLPKEIAKYNLSLDRLDREQKNVCIPTELNGKYVEAIREYRQALTDDREKRIEELIKIQEFFESVSDPFMKTVLTERFVKGKTWWEVVYSLSSYGTYTAASLKQACLRYLRKRGITMKG